MPFMFPVLMNCDNAFLLVCNSFKLRFFFKFFFNFFLCRYKCRLYIFNIFLSNYCLCFFHFFNFLVRLQVFFKLFSMLLCPFICAI